ncbi:MAG: hypothetical protein HDT02_03680 [Bacteroidales bacterium]|nr:hypothetical protein [Bacteroidales bacterium]
MLDRKKKGVSGEIFSPESLTGEPPAAYERIDFPLPKWAEYAAAIPLRLTSD